MLKKLLYLSNFFFLALYLILAWHNRLSSDDFHYWLNVQQYAIFKGTLVEYNNYNSRWLSILFVHAALRLLPFVNIVFILSILPLIAITLSTCYLLNIISCRFLSFNPGKIVLINFSIFFVNAFFYSSIDRGTIWFWFSAIPTYLWSFIFLILGCAIILSPKKHQVIKSIILSLCFFYIGGSAEAFSAFLLIILFITILVSLFNYYLPDRKTFILRLCLAFLFCLASLIVLYLAPGNIVRRSWIGEISVFKAFSLNIKTTGWIALHWISGILPFALLFSLPLLYAGKKISIKNSTPIESFSKATIRLFIAALLYGILIFTLNYPLTYLLCGIAPGRALAPVSFLTWVLFAYSFFYIGYKTNIKESIIKKINFVFLILCISLNIFNFEQQFIITGKYAGSYDLLMKELISKKDKKNIIIVSPLPSSGMLVPLGLSHDSLANNNLFVKQALGLRANIMLAE